MNPNKSVSLVLGSGGARGMAHIGVIEVLEERGYHITEIAGSSVGALVGGIYAKGSLADFKDWICDLGGGLRRRHRADFPIWKLVCGNSCFIQYPYFGAACRN